MRRSRHPIRFLENRRGSSHPEQPYGSSRIRTPFVLMLATLLLAGIAYISNVLLVPQSVHPEAPIDDRTKPTDDQASKTTGEQLGLVFENDASQSDDETIGLSDTNAISALTDTQWGSGPFSTAVIARAVADGYQIDAGKSGIDRSSIREEQEGSIVHGRIRIVGKEGVDLGILTFSFNKKTSDLSFSNNDDESGE